MRCQKHNKELVGSCQWCGISLCKLEVGKRLNTKLFCLDCSESLGPQIEKRQMQLVREQKLKENREKHYRKILE